MNKLIRSSLYLLSITTLSAFILSSSHTFADDPTTANASVSVPLACTVSATGLDSHTATLEPGTYSGASGSVYEQGIGKTTMKLVCNDDNGFSIYAVGYTGNSLDSANHTSTKYGIMQEGKCKK